MLRGCSGVEVLASAPRLLVNVLDIGRGSQAVGLIVKLGRSMET